MKKNISKFLGIGLVGLMASTPSLAQLNGPIDDLSTNVFNFTPQFLVCIIAGVIIALGFQLVLTILSVASGVTLVGNLEKKQKSSVSSSKSSTHDKNETPLGVKISSGMGIWNVITVSISLFFASLFAVKLSLIPSNAIGVTLGLVIWALFFMVMMYLEVKSISYLLGGIINLALKGIRTAASGVNKLFSSSVETKYTRVAENTVGAIRNEITHALNKSHIDEKIGKYLKKLEPKELDYTKIRKEIEQLLSDVEIKQHEKDQLGFEKDTFIKLAESHPHLAKDKSTVMRLAEIFVEVVGTTYLVNKGKDKLFDAIEKFTPASGEDIQKFKDKIGNYLKSSKKESLSFDNIKSDFEKIIRDPVSSKEVIKRRVKMMDKATVVSFLTQRSDLNKDEADKVLGYVEKAIDFVRGKVATGTSTPESVSQTYIVETDVSVPVDHRLEPHHDPTFKEKVEDKIRNYLASFGRDEFDYDKIKADFQHIFHDPSSTYSILKTRLDQYDRDSIVALLSSRDYVSPDKAERIADKIVDAKNTVLEKSEKVEMEVKRKVEEAKKMALHEAENTRKTTASAAWWLLASAVFSGIASVLGGILALTL